RTAVLEVDGHTLFDILLVEPLGGAVATALPAWTCTLGIAGQAFALLGTLVGAFTIAIGVGPRTVPDVVYHAAILFALSWGLVVAARAPADRPRTQYGRTLGNHERSE